MEKNPVCEMLGIQYPVIQGGMAWIADADLAAAVSNAGGLGLIAAMNSNGEQLRTQIKKAKEFAVASEYPDPSEFLTDVYAE